MAGNNEKTSEITFNGLAKVFLGLCILVAVWAWQHISLQAAISSNLKTLSNHLINEYTRRGEQLDYLQSVVQSNHPEDFI